MKFILYLSLAAICSDTVFLSQNFKWEQAEIVQMQLPALKVCRLAYPFICPAEIIKRSTKDFVVRCELPLPPYRDKVKEAEWFIGDMGKK